MNRAVALGGHLHLWQLTEVEFVDAHVIQRLECLCGATDFVFVT